MKEERFNREDGISKFFEEMGVSMIDRVDTRSENEGEDQ